MKKLTVALSAAAAITAATVGLASPALASPSAFDPGMLPQCSVQVNHNGTNVNVVWC